MMTEQELREWFAGRVLPTGPIQISKSTTIEDLQKSVDSMFVVLQHVTAPKIREPRIIDLMEIKAWVEANEK